MILEEIQKKMPGFTKSEKQVAEYILAHANAVTTDRKSVV